MTEYSCELRDLARICWAAAHQSTENLHIHVSESLASYGIERHLVGPLLYKAADRGLVSIEPTAMETLKQHYLENLRRLMHAEVRLKKIQDEFSAVGISAQLLKGLSLSQALYPEPADRTVGDLDLLVPPEQFKTATEILYRLNYIKHREVGFPSGWRDRLLFVARKGSTFVRQGDPLDIDLHHRAFPAPQYGTDFQELKNCFSLLPSGIDNLSDRQRTTMAVYLMTHGSLSGWAQLKWLLDFALLLKRLPTPGVRHLLEHGKRSGHYAALVTSMGLCEDLFEPMGLSSFQPESNPGYALKWRKHVCLQFLNHPENLSNRATRLKAQPTYTLAKPFIPRASIGLAARLATNLVLEPLLDLGIQVPTT